MNSRRFSATVPVPAAGSRGAAFMTVPTWTSSASAGTGPLLSSK